MTCPAFLSTLACAVCLNAQMTVTLERPPARSPEIEISNHSSVSLTAFAVTMAPSTSNRDDGAPFSAFVDAAIATDRIASPRLSAAMPLLPDRKFTVPVPSRARPGQDLFGPLIVSAGVFADGTTTGDPALLARLLARRSSMLQAVELTRAILADAGAHNVPRPQLIEQFRKLADSVDHWYLPPEQQVGRALYQSVMKELMNLPEPQLGSPFPPGAFVRQETDSLNRQRAMLLESQPGLNRVSAVSPQR